MSHLDYIIKEESEMNGEISTFVKQAGPVTGMSAVAGLALAAAIKPVILSAGLGFVVGGGIGYLIYKKVLKK